MTEPGTGVPAELTARAVIRPDGAAEVVLAGVVQQFAARDVSRVAGDITESMGAATTGRSKWYASICQPTETSSGSLVRREGTTATSSKEKACRPRLPRPISIWFVTGPA